MNNDRRDQPSVESKPTVPRSVAVAFANALDRDDFQAARGHLADDCVYVIGTEPMQGAEAIVGAYRSTSEKGRRIFDSLSYASGIVDVAGARVTIQFTDTITHASHRHEFRCRQCVEVDARGLIVRIEHREIDGERDQLNAFFRRAAIDW